MSGAVQYGTDLEIVLPATMAPGHHRGHAITDYRAKGKASSSGALAGALLAVAILHSELQASAADGLQKHSLASLRLKRKVAVRRYKI